MALYLCLAALRAACNDCSGGAMQLLTIPTAYFPTTVLFIDDCRDFALNFVLHLDEDLAYRLYESPHEALDYLAKNEREVSCLDKRCIDRFNTQELLDKRAIWSIQAEAANPQRFAEISVVVVDCTMPEMDGLEFCRQIASSAVKKVVLCDKSSEKMVKKAYENGLIDGFIRKKDKRAVSLIMKAIRELQYRYLQHMSTTIAQAINLEVPTRLYDKKFADFFRQICQENNIVEYYLLDAAGSFLLLDDDAQSRFLIVKNEKDANWYYSADLAGVEVEKNLLPLEDIVSYHQHLQWIDAEELSL